MREKNFSFLLSVILYVTYMDSTTKVLYILRNSSDQFQVFTSNQLFPSESLRYSSAHSYRRWSRKHSSVHCEPRENHMKCNWLTVSFSEFRLQQCFCKRLYCKFITQVPFRSIKEKNTLSLLHSKDSFGLQVMPLESVVTSDVVCDYWFWYLIIVSFICVIHTGLVHGRHTCSVLDVWLLFHSGLPHWKPAEFCPKIHHPHWPAQLRLWSHGGQGTQKPPRGW